MIGIPAVVVAGLAYYFLAGGRYISTDDSYVQLGRAAISASVEGRIIEVDVVNNEKVKKGQVLFKLDPADYQIALQRAQAAMAAARAEAQGLLATYKQAEADVAQSKETQTYADRESARQKNLATSGVRTQGQADDAAHAAAQAKTAISVAEQRLTSALAAIGGDPNASVDTYPHVLQAKAELDQAQLNLGYTMVVAPSDGTVTKVDQIQVGNRIAASQSLFWLLTGKPWIEANFKEDQLAHMRVGQPATIDVDAYDHELKGHVDSLSPGTGASFALLPPENATGNWVKVVQRLPVRILIDDDTDISHLGAGLSADVTVDTQPQGSH